MIGYLFIHNESATCYTVGLPIDHACEQARMLFMSAYLSRGADYHATIDYWSDMDFATDDSLIIVPIMDYGGWAAAAWCPPIQEPRKGKGRRLRRFGEYNEFEEFEAN